MSFGVPLVPLSCGKSCTCTINSSKSNTCTTNRKVSVIHILVVKVVHVLLIEKVHGSVHFSFYKKWWNVKKEKGWAIIRDGNIEAGESQNRPNHVMIRLFKMSYPDKICVYAGACVCLCVNASCEDITTRITITFLRVKDTVPSEARSTEQFQIWTGCRTKTFLHRQENHWTPGLRLKWPLIQQKQKKKQSSLSGKRKPFYSANLCDWFNNI